MKTKESPADPKWKRLTQIIGIFISAGILFLLYSRIEVDRLIETFSKISPFYCLLILLTFVVIYILLAWRWKIMVSPPLRVTFLECFKVVAASGALSIVIPAKLGAFSKIYFMNRLDAMNTKQGVSVVIYEKLSDLSAMSLVFIIGCLLNNRYDPLIATALIMAVIFLFCFALLHGVNIFEKPLFKSLNRFRRIGKLVEYAKVVHLFRQDPEISNERIVRINLLTLLLWIVHTAQIIFFFYALNLDLPIIMICSYMFCAIFIGLLPISIAGIGTRDLAIVYLFKGIITYTEAISIGILCTLRYIVPALFGLPFFIKLFFLKKYKPS